MPWSVLHLGKVPGLRLTAQARDLVVIIGKSFKPPARGVPAVKAQTSTRAQTQGRSVPGSASLGGGNTLLGGQRRVTLGLGIYYSSAVVSWCRRVSRPAESRRWVLQRERWVLAPGRELQWLGGARGDAGAGTHRGPPARSRG